MDHSKKTEDIVFKFASQYGLNLINFACKYSECLAYNVSCAELQETFYGYPHFVLIREDLKCRFANDEEIIEIMKIAYQ